MTKIILPEIKPGQGPDDILIAIGNGFEDFAGIIFTNYILEIQLKNEQDGDAITDSTAKRIAQENIGYESTRYSYLIARRAEILFGAYHPVFGKVDHRMRLTGTHSLKAGYLLERLNKTGYRLEETALYYPNRKNLFSLEYLLEKPHLDAILGSVSVVTDEEQKSIEEKSEAFFTKLGAHVTDNSND